jgi:hypothetical protein
MRLCMSMYYVRTYNGRYVKILMYVRLYVCTYLCVCLCMFVRMYVCVRMWVCNYVPMLCIMSLCTAFVHMHVRIRLYGLMYVCTYIRLNRQVLRINEGIWF